MFNATFANILPLSPLPTSIDATPRPNAAPIGQFLRFQLVDSRNLRHSWDSGVNFEMQKKNPAILNLTTCDTTVQMKIRMTWPFFRYTVDVFFFVFANITAIELLEDHC